ncbi:type II toxin-antitoxin system YafO family toxin [Pseudomonas rhizophila]|uniref:type II toxin-antitoxin system YafO family toxin n=1 Tax=Pseudomonas rhizophila TaxID=2045200 RepID=UPI0030DC240D
MIEVSPYFDSGFDLDDPLQKELRAGLTLAFAAYVKNRRHRLFGKDVPYHRPAGTVVTDVNLRHVHLTPTDPSKDDLARWHKFHTSDRCLVYARSTCQRYLLIAYIHASAHDQANDLDYIKALAKIAENWLYDQNIYADLAMPF